MIQKIKIGYTLVLLGFTLGATFTEKLRLAWFLLISRIYKNEPIISKRFIILSRGTSVPVWVRSNFADPFILREAFVSHDYDKGLPKVAPEVIFDIGANVGFVTLYLKTVYPEAKIFCFEPDPENFAQLQMNTQAFPDITCFKVGIGARTETQAFYRSPVFHMRNSLVPEEGSEKIEIELISLDDAFARAAVTKVDLMKFDVEGAEKEFVPTFPNFASVGAIVGELHPHLMEPQEYTAVTSVLQSHFNLTINRFDKKKEFFYGAHK